MPQLTILVPTRNEADNVEPLLHRLSASVESSTVVFFVDDSDDDTPDVIGEAEAHGSGWLDTQVASPIQRATQRRARRSGARRAGANPILQWVCVMDGDLQHPPEVVPRLLNAASWSAGRPCRRKSQCAGRWERGPRPCSHRRFVAVTMFAKAMFPHRLRGIRDPMSGFFLFRRDAMTQPMSPRGFKILLEMESGIQI